MVLLAREPAVWQGLSAGFSDETSRLLSVWPIVFAKLGDCPSFLQQQRAPVVPVQAATSCNVLNALGSILSAPMHCKLRTWSTPKAEQNYRRRATRSTRRTKFHHTPDAAAYCPHGIKSSMRRSKHHLWASSGVSEKPACHHSSESSRQVPRVLH